MSDSRRPMIVGTNHYGAITLWCQECDTEVKPYDVLALMPWTPITVEVLVQAEAAHECVSPGPPPLTP